MLGDKRNTLRGAATHESGHAIIQCLYGYLPQDLIIDKLSRGIFCGKVTSNPLYRAECVYSIDKINTFLKKPSEKSFQKIWWNGIDIVGGLAAEVLMGYWGKRKNNTEDLIFWGTLYEQDTPGADLWKMKEWYSPFYDFIVGEEGKDIPWLRSYREKLSHYDSIARNMLEEAILTLAPHRHHIENIVDAVVERMGDGVYWLTSEDIKTILKSGGWEMP